MTAPMVAEEVTRIIQVHCPWWDGSLDNWEFLGRLSYAERLRLEFELEIEFFRDIPSLLGSPAELIQWIHEGECPT